MNILSHIHIHRVPNPSGVGRVIDQLLSQHAELYSSAVHRMLVARSLYDQSYSSLSNHWKKASFIPHGSSLSLMQARWIWQGRPLAESYWDEVDVVYCPAESYVPTKQAKLVCTIHDVAGFEEHLYSNNFGRRLHCQKWRLLFQKMEQHADAVITVSEFSASRIAHFFPGLGKKLHVVYNAPHSIFGSAVPPGLEMGAAVSLKNVPFILVPGGLSFRKNAELILQAAPLLAKEFPDVKIVVAGKNNPRYVSVKEKDGHSNILLTGYVSDEQLNALYQQAAVVWFPSRYEGFGMPVIEAMVAGAPVVSSNRASIPEVAGSAALLCDIDNPAEHVEAIRSLLTDAALRAAVCKQSLEQGRTFTWTASARCLESIFQSLE